MKKLLMLAAATAAILPMTAQAAGTNPTATGSVTVETRVEDTCAITGLTDGTGQGSVYEPFTNAAGGVSSAADAKLKFNSGVLVDPTTARAKSVPKVVKLSGFCNYGGHWVSLESQNGGLTTPSNATSNGVFNRRIAYNAKISNWGGVSADLAAFDTGIDSTFLTTSNMVAKSGSTRVSLASHSTSTTAADLTIETVASTVPLVKGDYSDVLTIRLGRGFGS
jgi:hypothetical protein